MFLIVRRRMVTTSAASEKLNVDHEVLPQFNRWIAYFVP